jgi:hypothetical protein
MCPRSGEPRSLEKGGAFSDSSCPVDAARRALFDRVIIVDGNAAYISTQSLNAIGARSPATVMRVDPETTKLTIEAYEQLWSAATPL